MAAWDGRDRREGPRRAEDTDLDFTWQNAVRALHNRMDSHFQEERDNAARITAIEENMSELLEPEYGRMAKMEHNIELILDLKKEATGGVRLLLLLGGIASSAAAFWAWAATHISFR